MFSENGNGSSKRLIGFMCILAVLFCTIFLTVTSGPCSVVEGLLQTITISACALLGVSSVTSIWKKKEEKSEEKSEE